MCEQAQEQRGQIEVLEGIVREYVQFLRGNNRNIWAAEVLVKAKISEG